MFEIFSLFDRVNERYFVDFTLREKDWTAEEVKQNLFDYLDLGIHRNHLLQVAYDKHGKENFDFMVRETSQSQGGATFLVKVWVDRFQNIGYDTYND